MKAVKQYEAEDRLNDLVDDLIVNGRSSRRSREIFNNIICKDPSLIIKVIGKSKLHDAWLNKIDKRLKELNKGEVKAQIVSTGVKSNLCVVSGYVQQRPPRTNLLSIAADVTALVFRIDGDDLRDWSIGRCKTAVKRKNRESQILQYFADSYGHLGDEKTIGELCSDDALKEILNKF